jgi:hypothetical protein
MKRKVYKVVYANSEEFQKSIYHFSQPFKTLNKAKDFENEKGRGINNTRIELHNEIFRNNSWEPDFAMVDSWMQVVE